MKDIENILAEQLKTIGINDVLSLSIVLNNISSSEEQIREELKQLSFTWSSTITFSKMENTKNSYNLSIKDRGANFILFAKNVDTLTFYLDTVK